MRTFVVVAAATLALSGCSGSSTGSALPQACGPDVDPPAEVVNEPELDVVPEEDADLVLELSSTTRESTHVVVRLDGRVALDVRTPAVPAGCSHAPVHSHPFRIHGDAVRVTVTTDRGQRRSVTVPLDGPRRWVVVQPQDGFPVGLDVFDEEPAWG